MVAGRAGVGEPPAGALQARMATNNILRAMTARLGFMAFSPNMDKYSLNNANCMREHPTGVVEASSRLVPAAWKQPIRRMRYTGGSTRAFRSAEVMMAHAEKSVLIHRPVQSVFDFVVNGANNKLWQPAVLDVLPMGEAPFGVGSTFRQGRKGPGGREAADYELTEVRPNELIAFRVIAGPTKQHGVYRFETRGG